MSYADKRAARIASLRTRAETKKGEAAAAFERANRIASVIPLGQPILVGHHSERRHRKDLQRIDNGMRRGVEAQKEAEELSRRASAAETNTAISSDDPEAVTKLRAKLEKLQRAQRRNKEINATIRTAQRHAKRDGVPWELVATAALLDMGLPQPIAAEFVKPDFAGRVGVADYVLTNLAADIRRTEKRLTELEARAATEAPAPEQHGSVLIDQADNGGRPPKTPGNAWRTTPPGFTPAASQRRSRNKNKKGARFPNDVPGKLR